MYDKHHQTRTLATGLTCAAVPVCPHGVPCVPPPLQISGPVCVHRFRQWALPPGCLQVHVVTDGETCLSLAAAAGLSLEELLQLNSGKKHKAGLKGGMGADDK